MLCDDHVMAIAATVKTAGFTDVWKTVINDF